jgi:DNA polymerase
MVNACFNAEAKGYPVIGTVHDELITLVPEDFGSPHELEEVLRAKPKWATDCPVNAEGWEGPRYRK